MFKKIDTFLSGVDVWRRKLTSSLDATIEKVLEQQSVARDKKRIVDIDEASSKKVNSLPGYYRKISARISKASSARSAGNKTTTPKKSLGKRLARFAVSLTLFWVAFGLLFISGLVIWIALLPTPDFDSFTKRKIASSTKIYDRTGEVVLFNIGENIQRTIVDIEDVSPYAKNALIALEDEDFYNHRGVDISGTTRAVIKTGLSVLGVRKGGLQGGSTITQQLIKNTLLIKEKRISRKMKEWFLAFKLEKVLTKEEILEHYLNELPYGGQLYGVETAAQAFFGKTSKDITLAESAYLAAIPNAPTLFSPYKEDTSRLDARKDVALQKMLDNEFITKKEYREAKNEDVLFRPKSELNAKAIHFVEYVRAYLEEEYGADVVENEGLRVVTTLDYSLQRQAEIIVREEALKNEKDWNASNMALVATDPQTGEILTMVGSRGYTDSEIDGKVNVTLSPRQPGSSFKPIVYLAALAKGYTDQTILFDVATQFNTSCDPSERKNVRNCYAPKNYDSSFRGPLSIRQSLAESRNIPAVKILYMVGAADALSVAKNLGIKGLKSAGTYGLTLVLGGGEVRLLDLTGAYGTIANGGVYYEPQFILSVEDQYGEFLEENKSQGERVVSQKAANGISSILSDNSARTPLLGSNSFMNFGAQYDVAAKTGTTNGNRDAWVMGYSPSLSVGVWSGNNDNSPMLKGSTISGNAWRRFMKHALPTRPNLRFGTYSGATEDSKPVMRGLWEGGKTVLIDITTREPATPSSLPENIIEVYTPEPHSILHWVDRANPNGLSPASPSKDSQYRHWEHGVQSWVESNRTDLLPNQQVAPVDLQSLPYEQAVLELQAAGVTDSEQIAFFLANLPNAQSVQPILLEETIELVEVETEASTFSVLRPSNGDSFNELDAVAVIVEATSPTGIASIEIYIEDQILTTLTNAPYSASFIPQVKGYQSGENVNVKIVKNSNDGTAEVRSIQVEIE